MKREPIEYARKLTAIVGAEEAEKTLLEQAIASKSAFVAEAYAAFLELQKPRHMMMPLAGIPRTFYLGAAPASWLAESDVPLFIARQSLGDRKVLPRAKTHWALDSGGFTQLQRFGKWTIDVPTYVAEVRRFRDEIGQMDFAASQDWMCEPMVIKGGKTKDGVFVGTGLSVEEHIRRTVENFVELKSVAPDVPWMPTLQGWNLHDYRACADLYERYGVRLAEEERVGLGSVCRRETASTISRYVTDFGGGDRSIRFGQNGERLPGMRLHGFGVKKDALPLAENDLISADSQAWSAAARCRRREMRGSCPLGKKACNNCFHWALEWRAELLSKLGPDWQLDG